jgi:hypothetical protein
METAPAWVTQVLGESAAGSEAWLTNLMKLLVGQSAKKAQNTTVTLLYAGFVVTGLIALSGVPRIGVILVLVASFVIAFGY